MNVLAARRVRELFPLPTPGTARRRSLGESGMPYSLPSSAKAGNFTKAKHHVLWLQNDFDLLVMILHNIRQELQIEGDLGAFFFQDYLPAESELDHQHLLIALTVRLGRVLVGIVIPVLGFAPHFLELLLKVLVLGMMDGEVLVNGAPCAIQGAYDPTVNKIGIRSVED